MSRYGMLLALGLLAAVLAGCNAQRVTRENYDRVSTGMSYDEVVNILGQPDSVDGGEAGINGIQAGARVATWRSNDRRITITFVNDRVTVKTADNL